MAEDNYYAFPMVKYTDNSLKLIESFSKMEEKSGDFWNGDDKELAVVKKEIKDHYLFVQDYKCAYCQQRMEVGHNGMWDTEHVINKDEYPGFMFEPRNLCVSCKDCNTIKGSKRVLKNKNRKTFPSLAGDYNFCHPHFHEYSRHIKVVKEAMLYLPISDEGRKMIEICGLLRFVYKYAGYDYNLGNVLDTLMKLAKDLQDAGTSFEQIAVMTLIKKLMEEGIEKASKDALKKYS